jgi:formiminoglutamase
MKILSSIPKSIAEPGAIDKSRFGFWVEPKNLSEANTTSHGIAIIGFADDTGIKNVGGRIGAALAPEEIRKRLYKFTLGKPKIPVYDFGTLSAANSLKKTLQEATEFVRQLHSAGHTVITLGGGHDFGFPQALGLLKSTQKNKSAIINIDAHLDLRKAHPEINSGSPWYLLNENEVFKKSKSKILEFGIQPHCNAESLVDYAKQNKIEIHWLEEIRAKKQGAVATFSALIGKQVKLNQILVSLDIDSIQWQSAPGCSAPQVSGFSAEEALKFSFLSGKQKKVKSFGIFEVSPPLDPDGRTSTLAAHCIISFLRGRGGI